MHDVEEVHDGEDGPELGRSQLRLRVLRVVVEVPRIDEEATEGDVDLTRIRTQVAEALIGEAGLSYAGAVARDTPEKPLGRTEELRTSSTWRNCEARSATRLDHGALYAYQSRHDAATKKPLRWSRFRSLADVYSSARIFKKGEGTSLEREYASGALIRSRAA